MGILGSLRPFVWLSAAATAAAANQAQRVDVDAIAIATLQREAQARSPAGRSGAALAYDAMRKEMVLFGGIASDGKSFPSDLWAWNGRSWRQLIPSDGLAPSGRAFHNLVFDAARQRMVMFGGRRDGILSDMWEWDGVRWHQIVSDTLTLLHAAATYDPARRRVVAFGGLNNSGPRRDVIEWDGRKWNTRGSAGPEVGLVFPAVLAASPTGDLTIVNMQSGRSSDSIPALTWELNGSAWRRREIGPALTSLQPAVSAPDGTIYIYQRAAVWLSTPLVHTRKPDGTWVTVSPSLRPEGNSVPAVAYDSDRRRFVLYSTDLWEWNGARWAKRP